MAPRRRSAAAAVAAIALAVAVSRAAAAGGPAAAAAASPAAGAVTRPLPRQSPEACAAASGGEAVTVETLLLQRSGELQRGGGGLGVAADYLSTERVLRWEGNNVGEPRRGSAEECQATCDETSGCRSFAYGYGWCFFKDHCVSSSDPLVAHDAGNAMFKTYYKTCEAAAAEPHSAYSVTARVVQEEGNDLGSPGWRSPEACMVACDANPACNSFAYGWGGCWLKDKCITTSEPIVGEDAGNSMFQTYYKPCAIETSNQVGQPGYMETERVLRSEGGGAGSISDVSLGSCKSACDANNACRSFSYGHRLCYMKDKCVTTADAIVGASAPNAGFKTYYKPCDAAEQQRTSTAAPEQPEIQPIEQEQSAEPSSEAATEPRFGMNLHWWRKADSAQYMVRFYEAGIRRFRVWHGDCWGGAACSYWTLQQASDALKGKAGVKFQVTLMKPETQPDSDVEPALGKMAEIVAANGHGISSIQVDHVGVNPSESELCILGFGPGSALFSSVVGRVVKAHQSFPDAVISLPWQQNSDSNCWTPFLTALKQAFSGSFPASLKLGFHATIYPFWQDGLSIEAALGEVRRGSASSNNFNKLQERVEQDFGAAVAPATAVAAVSEIGWANGCDGISRAAVTQKSTQDSQCTFIANVVGTDWPATPYFEAFYFAGWPYEGWGDGKDCSSNWSPFTATASLCPNSWGQSR